VVGTGVIRLIRGVFRMLRATVAGGRGGQIVMLIRNEDEIIEGFTPTEAILRALCAQEGIEVNRL